MKGRNYLALGDSYTIGTGVAAADSWPVQMADSLDLDVTIVARNGWTTDDLMAGIEAAELTPPYDLVSLLIGVNDQYDNYQLGGYRERFATLLDRAIGLAGGRPGRVFVVSIPDYSYTPRGGGDRTITTELAQLNATAREIARSRGVPFRNITPISVEAADDPALIAEDNLHPSGKQYTRWLDEVLLLPVRALLR